MTTPNDEHQDLTFSELEERLTPKRRAFCREFILDLNATQAAIRAGYSKKSAANEGHRLLRNDEIVAFLEALRADLMAATGVTKEAIASELIKIARSPLTDPDTGEKVVKMSDRINAYKELNKMYGNYEPTKTENTHQIETQSIVTLDDYA